MSRAIRSSWRRLSRPLQDLWDLPGAPNVASYAEGLQTRLPVRKKGMETHTSQQMRVHPLARAATILTFYQVTHAHLVHGKSGL